MARAIATKSTWINDKVTGLVEKARHGDETALAELKSHLKDRPQDWQQLCLIVGDLASLAERSLIKAAAGHDLLVKDAIRVKLDHMEAEFLGPAPTPLERLLGQRIRACWLQLSYAEGIYAQMGDLTLTEGEYFQRRMDRVQRRYLAAIKALAQVRRLLGPSVQLNVGLQQVNVAG